MGGDEFFGGDEVLWREFGADGLVVERDGGAAREVGEVAEQRRRGGVDLEDAVGVLGAGGGDAGGVAGVGVEPAGLAFGAALQDRAAHLGGHVALAAADQ